MASWRNRWLLIALEGSLVLLAIALGWLLDQPPLARCAWSAPGIQAGLTATLFLLACVFLCFRWPNGPWRSLLQLVDNTLVPLLKSWTLPEMLAASALAGLGEEMLFRGVLQEVCERWLNGLGVFAPVLAVFIVAVLFGLVHWLSRAYAIFATLMGVFLGAQFVLIGDLAAPIVTHALYDFVALVYLARFRSTERTVLPDLTESPTA